MRQTWIIDGGELSIEGIENLLYENKAIKKYLNESGWFFLAANKGMGKTTLLAEKRYKISQKKGVLIIPKNQPYLDNMSNMSEISRQHKEWLCNIENVHFLWEFCLKLSTLTHVNEIDDKSIEKHKGSINEEFFTSIIENKCLRPTDIFREILTTYNPSQISQTLKKQGNIIDRHFKNVSTPIYFFIDKVDQAISNQPRNSWITIQAGLILAAWNIRIINNHIKVFATIRQEAYNNFNSPIKTNLENSVHSIKYDKDEIEKMLNKLTLYYEGIQTYKEFLKFETIFNDELGHEESTYDYIYRHTLGRPRDFVLINSQLSKIDNMTPTKLKETIDNTSAKKIVKNIFEEQKIFLDCLKDQNNRTKFLNLISYNILNREEIRKVWNLFHVMQGMIPKDIPYNELVKGYNHPFSELLKCGLLGYLTNYGHKEFIKFNMPDDLQDFESPYLPSNETLSPDFYFIHPALNGMIKSLSGATNFYIFKYIQIGNSYSWTRADMKIYEIQKDIIQIDSYEAKLLLFEYLDEIVPDLKKNNRISDIAQYKQMLNKMEPFFNSDFTLEACVKLEEMLR